MIQAMAVVNYFNIQLVSLDASIVRRHLQNLDLQTIGIRAADALHLTTAAEFDADIVVSGDRAILALDGLISNRRGSSMRCLDSDQVLPLI